MTKDRPKLQQAIRQLHVGYLHKLHLINQNYILVNLRTERIFVRKFLYPAYLTRLPPLPSVINMPSGPPGPPLPLY